MTETEIVEVDEDLLDRTRQLAEARKNKNAWTKVEEAAKKELRSWIDSKGANAAVTASGAPVFHLSRFPKDQLDLNKLRAKYPEVYADCVEEGETVRFEIDYEFD